MGIYHSNPPRGCGSKAPDACYAEGGDFTPLGGLYNWVWLLGDGLERYISFTDREVPPRQVVGIDPVLSIMTLSYIPAGGPDIRLTDDALDEYRRLSSATKSPGIADHVGDQFYSAMSFYDETNLYGPSRRITKQVAKTLSELISRVGPIPMVFTHSKVPVFRNEVEKNFAKQFVYLFGNLTLDWPDRWDDPTWERDSWGQYVRRGQTAGRDHYLLPILDMIDELKYKWQDRKDSKDWQDARKFFKGLRYVKQTFGMSWLCKVSYTLPESGSPDDEVLELPGINIINLKDPQTGEANEQTEETPVGVD